VQNHENCSKNLEKAVTFARFMKYSQYIGVAAAIGLIIVSFFPWVYVPSLGLTLDGFHGWVNTHLSFGKQGRVHIFFAVVMIVFYLVQTVWAKRTNIFIAFLNLGWAIKNYIIFTICRSGECPQIKPALYMLVAFSIITQIAALLPKMNIKSS